MAEQARGRRNFTPFPKKNNGKIDRVKIKQLYFDSLHVEWTQFCREFNWDPNGGGPKIVPEFNEWKKDKKSTVIRARHEHLLEKLDEHKERWSGEVLEALTKLPELNKLAVEVTRAYWRSVATAITNEAIADREGKKVADKDRFYKRFRPGDIAALASATKQLTDSYQKSLMMNEFSLKNAEDEAKMSEEDLNKKAEGKEVDGVTFQLTLPDGNTVSDKAIAEHLHSFYDKPQVIEAQVSDAG